MIFVGKIAEDVQQSVKGLGDIHLFLKNEINNIQNIFSMF